MTVESELAGVHLNLTFAPEISASNVASVASFNVPYAVNVTTEPS